MNLTVHFCCYIHTYTYMRFSILLVSGLTMADLGDPFGFTGGLVNISCEVSMYSSEIKTSSTSCKTTLVGVVSVETVIVVRATATIVRSD